MGELSEIFQWRGDSVAHGLVGFSNDDKRHVGEEMSDVRPLLLKLSALHRMLTHAACCQANALLHLLQSMKGSCS